eukprot:m51a1_g9521 hypothetical protein (90) ;mRNA; f:756657-756926
MGGIFDKCSTPHGAGTGPNAAHPASSGGSARGGYEFGNNRQYEGQAGIPPPAAQPSYPPPAYDAAPPPQQQPYGYGYPPPSQQAYQGYQ